MPAVRNNVVTLREVDRRRLWERAGNQCSIFKRALVREGAPPEEGAVVGREYPIRDFRQTTANALILSPQFLDGYDNYVLLCADDTRIVRERHQEFNPGTLAALKLSHENSVVRITGAARESQSSVSVSLLVHTAVFLPTSPPYYFLKITNESHSSTVQLDRVWFATNPELVVDNRQRPLPALLAPGDMFETWQLVDDVAASPNIAYLARAQLGDDTIIESRPNTNVSPAGRVGGGGRPLTSLIKSVAAMNHDRGQLIEKEWDVFISHAHEDKDEIVRALAHALRKRGLRVWYDEFELRMGDILRRKIDQGIARSAFGIVVLSHAFFAKRWANYELDGLVTRSMGGGQVVLPVWHRITVSDVMGYSPSLAGVLARDAGEIGIERLADEIQEVVVGATGTT